MPTLDLTGIDLSAFDEALQAPAAEAPQLDLSGVDLEALDLGDAPATEAAPEPAAPAAQPMSWVDEMLFGLEAVNQGLLGKLSDELEAGVYTAFQAAKGAVTGVPVDIGQTYDQKVGELRKSYGAFADANPVMAIGTEVAASMLPVAAAGRLAQGTGAAAQVAKATVAPESMVASAATYGGVAGYGGSEAQGEQLIKDTALGITGGGLVAGVVQPLAKAVGRMVQERGEVAAHKTLAKMEDEFRGWRDEGLSPEESLGRTMDKFRVDEAATRRLQQTAGRELRTDLGRIGDVPEGTPAVRAYMERQVQKAKAMEEPLIKTGTIPSINLDRVVGQTLLTGRELRAAAGRKFEAITGHETPKEFADWLLQPLYSNLKKYSPRAANMLRETDMMAHNIETDLLQKSHNFREGYYQMAKKDAVALDKALRNADYDAAKAVASKYDQVKVRHWGKDFGFQKKTINMASEVDNMRQMMDDVYKLRVASGLPAGHVDEFFPRVVKDFKGLAKKLSGEDANVYERALRKALVQKKEVAARAGKKAGEVQLTKEEEIDILNRVTRGQLDDTTRVGESKRIRKLREVPEDAHEFYDSAPAALLSYASRTSRSIAKHKLFGASSNKFLGGNANLEDSVGEFLRAERAAGRITLKEQEFIKKAFEARFQGGERQQHRALGTMRNIAYMLTLGHPGSAAIQLADLGWSAYTVGLKNTIAAAFNSIRAQTGKRGAGHIIMEDVGLHNIAQEMEDPGNFARALNTMLKWSGFRTLDRMSKETLINGAIAKARKEFNTPEFAAKWQSTFGTEFNALKTELAQGKFGENSRYLAWHILSGRQPISLSEMPGAYLTSPNGRTFYALKSFMLKQLDAIRQEAFHAKNPTEGARNMMKLAIALTVSGMSTGALRDFMHNKPVSMDSMSDRAMDTFLRTLGVSQYWVDHYGAKGELFGGAADLIMPAWVGIGDTVGTDAVKNMKDFGSSFKSSTYIPVVGRLYNSWFGDGAEKRRKEEEKKVKF